jgi:hypothetical protein
MSLSPSLPFKIQCKEKANSKVAKEKTLQSNIIKETKSKKHAIVFLFNISTKCINQ